MYETIKLNFLVRFYCPDYVLFSVWCASTSFSTSCFSFGLENIGARRQLAKNTALNFAAVVVNW